MSSNPQNTKDEEKIKKSEYELPKRTVEKVTTKPEEKSTTSIPHSLSISTLVTSKVANAFNYISNRKSNETKIDEEAHSNRQSNSSQQNKSIDSSDSKKDKTEKENKETIKEKDLLEEDKEEIKLVVQKEVFFVIK